MKKTPYSTTDKDIRPSLKRALASQYGNDKHTLIVEELGLYHGQVRVDVAVINGSLHGFEIKSDRDNFLRLDEQMRAYNSILDYVTLVVGKSHIHEALETIPDWWGIIMAKSNANEIDFIKLRDSQKNDSTDKSSVASLLWREEALSILEKISADKGVRSKPRRFIYERLAETLDAETLKKQVRQKLRSRTNWRSD